MRFSSLIVASLLVGCAAAAQSDSDFSAPPLPGDPSFVPEPYAPSDTGAAGGDVSAAVERDAFTTRRLNRITAGPLSLLTATFSAEYERAVTDRVSLFAGPRFGVVGTYSIGLSAGARYFPMAKDTAPEGLWFGPELWLQYGSQSGELGGVTYSNEENTAFGLAMAGYTLIYENGFTLSFGAGIGGGYYARSGTGIQNITFSPTGLSSPSAKIGSVSELSLKPTVGAQFNLGYAF